MANRFNLEYDIPSNKIVEIFIGDGSTKLISQPLILNDDFSIKASSTFGELWEASPNNFLNLLSSQFNIPSGQFALQGAQIWQKTDPISININVSLEMDKDPFIDVVAPSLVLTQTTLPKIRGNISEKNNNFFSENLNLKLKTLIPPGPNLQTLINLMKNNNNTASNTNALLAGNNGLNGVYDVRIGFVKFHNVIIKSVEPTYSKTVAISNSKNGKLFPVRADLSIEMCTMEVATTDMISSIINSF